jgi:hypothetical protein
MADEASKLTREVAKRLEQHVVLCVVFAAVITGCSGHDSGPSVTESTASALAVVELPTPPLDVRNYLTSGTYPQVSGGDARLKRVNSEIRSAVVGAQREYAQEVMRRWGASMPQLFEGDYPYAGVYTTSPRSNLISASTVVVSALVPLRATAPGGTGGSTWISVTVAVRSGTRIGIADLFAQPDHGLRTLAAAARKKVVTTNACVRASVFDPIGGEVSARGFFPTAENYRHFALVPGGIVVGLTGSFRAG